MTIRVALNHRTTYEYDRPVHLGPQVVRLRPAAHARTPVDAYSLRVTPADHYLNWQQDPFGNFLARLVFEKPTRRFEVEVDLIADMTVINPFDFFIEPHAESFPFEYEESQSKELAPYFEKCALTPRLEIVVRRQAASAERTIDFLVELNQQLQSEVEYLIRMEPGVQTPERTLEVGKGSCRDSAWLLVHVLRHLGFAARFVSGYLIQLKPDQKPLDGPAGTEVDFTDLHAWTEVFLPGAGWVGLDPTSGLFTGEGHIPLAATPSPSSAAPISGGVDEAEVEFDFAMSVTRIHEDPRVTLPYSREEWEQIESLGHAIDERLDEDDVRLTMGGEPTFVSIDDMESAQWNISATGEDKRRRSDELVRRLRRRFAPDALLHFGQGKWYPGESLPRWSFGCYWREDGEPVWSDPSLIADASADDGFDETDAQAFIEELATALGVDPEYTIPVYEDAMYYAWKENRLPPNVRAGESHAEDEEDRRRMAALFARGLDTPSGYVLPLREPVAHDGSDAWRTGRWPVRADHMFLLPGDSPLGLRLPLESLEHIPEGQLPLPAPVDPTVARDPLPQPILSRGPGVGSSGEVRRGSTAAAGARESDRSGGGDSTAVTDPPGAISFAPPASVEPPGMVRTALCVEARHGRMHVFMPPVDRLEPYLDLVGLVEHTAKTLDMPVLVEGYPPPNDPRLVNLKVTPDPGVIEVNIHPASNWSELVENTEALYEEARLTRLGTEKFDLDGKHSGTGGGNHVVVGSSTPLDSPFLRRPDLLGSFIRYWINHPSLSYLFSGRFIGPTSQAPRVDEGRPDALYELDVALRTLDTEGESARPWIVDRIFRHLLTDLTGNTHRAEICIDKLYSPDSSTGRLGLVELRGFEMPPHPEMSLTQQLLIRALISRFWRDPVQEGVVHWGTQLHDRFLLPHFLWEDLVDVTDDLRAHGVSLDPHWFAPHFEFRFPRIGTFVQRSVEVELRQAIEPWYVLGEEPIGGGMARPVDSSVERLQIKVEGLTEGRHVVACGGRQVPLHPTGVEGQFVAGVRYRAWQPPHCLHPTIPVDTPLAVELVDTWQNQSLGGCTYHVSNPSGSNDDRFPVNALEAESRRAARFELRGHTPGRIRVVEERPNPRFPMTLDLRRPARQN